MVGILRSRPQSRRRDAEAFLLVPKKLRQKSLREKGPRIRWLLGDSADLSFQPSGFKSKPQDIAGKSKAEINALLVRDGLHRAGYHAAIRKQQINLNLDYFRLVPCELSLSSPPLVPGSPHDRSEQIEIVKLDELGISKYVPDPRAAVVAELKRRETQALLPPSAA